MLLLSAISAAAALYIFVWPVVCYLVDRKQLRRFPAPSLAGTTNLWLFKHSFNRNRYLAVDAAHKRLGKVVRIAPNHMSFTSLSAIRDVHGHGSAIIKDEFYDVLNPGVKSMADTRSRAEHGQKRKVLAHFFSPGTVGHMEPIVQETCQTLVDELGKREGQVVDMRRWLNFFAYDAISAILFSMPYNFLRQGDDQCLAQSPSGKTYAVHAGRTFHVGAAFVATIAHLGPALAEQLKLLLSWTSGKIEGDNFYNMSLHLIRERMAFTQSSPDLFSRFGKMPLPEIIAECVTMMNAGNDTTHTALTNSVYLLATNPEVLAKLRDEVGAIVPESGDVLSYSQVRDKQYLRACIDESLRLRPPVGIGLPRQTPAQGSWIDGNFIPGYTTVSTPTWTLHHDETYFPKPYEYLPERWIDGSEEEKFNLKNYCLPFSLGSRACIGRNLAYLEQSVVLATLVRQFDFELVSNEMKIIERFNSNPEKLEVRLRRRSIGV